MFPHIVFPLILLHFCNFWEFDTRFTDLWVLRSFLILSEQLLVLRYEFGFRKEAAHHLLACVVTYCILELYSNGEGEYHLLLQFVSVHFCQFVPLLYPWSFQVKSCMCSKQLLSETAPINVIFAL